MNNILIFSYMYGNESSAPYSQDAKKMAAYIVNKTDFNVDVFTGYLLDNDPKRKENVVLISKRHSKLINLEKKRKKLSDQLKGKNFLKKCLAYIRLRFYYNIKHQKILRHRFPGYEVYNFSKREIRKLIKNNTKTYDAMLCYATPFTIANIAYNIKEKLGVKKFYVLTLDPYCDLIETEERLKRVQEERNVFSFSDKIFIPKEIFSNAILSPIKEFENKVEFIPNSFMEDNTKYKQISKDENINFVYAGMLYDDIRNPRNLLEFFLKLPQNYHLHLYYAYYSSKENIIEKYKDKLKHRIFLNGFISNQEEYKQTLGKADFLINLGNLVDTQIPSKAFSICSYGGPVIHFRQNKNDFVEKIFKGYEQVKILDYNNIDMQKFINFVEGHRNTKLSYDDIKKHFYVYTLDYFVEKLRQIILE